MPQTTHICAQCGREFVSNLSSARYCSDKCRSTANRKLREAREQQDPLTRLNDPELIDRIRRTIWWGLEVGGLLKNTVLDLELKSAVPFEHPGRCPICQGNNWYEAPSDGGKYLQCGDCRATSQVELIESGIRLTWADYLKSYNGPNAKPPTPRPLPKPEPAPKPVLVEDKVIEALLCIEEILNEQFEIERGGDYPDSCLYCSGTNKDIDLRGKTIWLSEVRHDEDCPVHRLRALLREDRERLEVSRGARAKKLREATD